MAKNNSTYYALLIAIDKYQHHDDLSAPVRDAVKFEKILTGLYGFTGSHITKLFNERATLIAIKEVLKRYERLRTDDTLIIFFAGHGQTELYDRINYWLPCDAGMDSKEKLRWLDSRTVQAAMEKTPARHVLLLNDCCFSGDFVGAARNLKEKEKDYLETAIQYRAREVLTSGMSEKVQDSRINGHSPFMYHLMSGMADHDETYLDSDQMYEYVKRGVKGQRPLHRLLDGHQDGGLVVLQRTRPAGTSGWNVLEPEPEPAEKKRTWGKLVTGLSAAIVLLAAAAVVLAALSDEKAAVLSAAYTEPEWAAESPGAADEAEAVDEEKAPESDIELPESSISPSVSPIDAGYTLAIYGVENEAFSMQIHTVVDRMMKKILSEKGLKDEETSGGLAVECLLDTYEYPPSEDTRIRFVEMYVVISMYKQGMIIYNVTTDTVKGGGFTVEKAAANAQDELLASLQSMDIVW